MNRTNMLIDQFIAIQNNILKLYKNASQIEGQYNNGVKTTTNILADLIGKKIALYQSILVDAAKEDMEISQEGYDTISDLLMKRKEKIKTMTFSESSKVVAYALENSLGLTQILQAALSKVEIHEIERLHLQDALRQLIRAEQKDQKVLSSILNVNASQPNA